MNKINRFTFSEDEDDDLQSTVISQTLNRKRKLSDNFDNSSVKSGGTSKYQGKTIIFDIFGPLILENLYP